MPIKQTQKLPIILSLSFSALSFSILFSVILLSGTAALGETRYIKPSSEVAVRRGQGVDFKIVAMVKDGISVEFLEENDAYARIRLGNNKEGWMLKRFLSNTPPLIEVVASLRTETEELKQKENELVQNLEEVSSSLAKNRMELDSTLNERNQIWTDFQTLQRETADAVQVNKELVTTKKKNKHLLQELTSAQQKSERLKKNSAIKWFLAGGGVLLLGMIIGSAMSGKSRRRKSLQL